MEAPALEKLSCACFYSGASPGLPFQFGVEAPPKYNYVRQDEEKSLGNQWG